MLHTQVYDAYVACAERYRTVPFGVRAMEVISTMRAAKMCGVHYTTIRRWVLDGSLPAYETPGGHLRVLREDIESFISSRRKKTRRGRQQGPVRVLVVDDDHAFRDSVVDFLGSDDAIDVREAEDGFAAGLLVGDFDPQVVVLDLLMPRLDGFETCQRLKAREQSRDVRVLILTGFATDENILRARACGADVCLAKPIGLDELRRAVLALAWERKGVGQGQRELARRP